MTHPSPPTEQPPALEDRIGHIAVRFPSCLPVLHHHRLDYCCGGNVPLSQACAQAGLDANAVLDQILATLDQELAAESWLERDDAALIDHLLQRYHQTHRQQLPTLIQMAAKVEQVHAEKADVPAGLAELLADWASDLEAHMQTEEQVLFPMILEGKGRDASATVSALEQEHQDHGQRLIQVRELTSDLTPSAHACTTWRALYSGLLAFERDLMAHIHLENHLLFVRALGSTPNLSS